MDNPLATTTGATRMNKYTRFTDMSGEIPCSLRDMSGNYLYFIQAIEVECDTSRYFKIGVSRDWRARLHGLETGLPFAVYPLVVIESSCNKVIEKKALDRFSHLQAKGEWFFVPNHPEDFLSEIGWHLNYWAMEEDITHALHLCCNGMRHLFVKPVEPCPEFAAAARIALDNIKREEEYEPTRRM